MRERISDTGLLILINRIVNDGTASTIIKIGVKTAVLITETMTTTITRLETVGERGEIRINLKHKARNQRSLIQEILFPNEENTPRNNNY